MYTIYCDGSLVYSSAMDAKQYVVTDPSLSLEINAAGSLTFTLAPGNNVYDDIRKLLSVVIVYDNGDEIFRGRVLNYDFDIYKNKTVYCEGDFSYFLDSIIRPYISSGQTVREHLQDCLDIHNRQVDAYKQFTLGTVNVRPDTATYLFNSDDHHNMLDEFSNMFLDRFDGYFKIRTDIDGSRILDYLSEPGAISNQSIEFGTNIIDLSQHVSAEDVATILIPLGSDGLDISSVNGGRDYIESENAIKLFGRIWTSNEWSEVTDANTLISLGQDYLNSIIEESIEIDLSAVDLHLINPELDKILVGNLYRVVSVPHGIDKYFMCSKADINLADPSGSNYTFGATPKSMTKKLATTANGVSKAVANPVALTTEDINAILNS